MADQGGVQDGVDGRMIIAPALMHALGISCLAIDADGEPDLTTWLCLELNGLQAYQPPVLPRETSAAVDGRKPLNTWEPGGAGSPYWFRWPP